MEEGKDSTLIHLSGPFSGSLPEEVTKQRELEVVTSPNSCKNGHLSGKGGLEILHLLWLVCKQLGVCVSFSHCPGGRGLFRHLPQCFRKWSFTEGDNEVAPPHLDARSSALCHPRPYAQRGRVGTQGGQVHRGLGRSPEGALPRPSPPLPRASRVKVKVPGPPRRSRIRGAGPARTWEQAPGTAGAMDGLGRRLRASLRLKRGHGGPSQNNTVEAATEPERTQEHSLSSFAGGQHFFEYLLVVSLKRKHSGDDYEPTITYQFPKRENLLRGQQEEEERLLKAIPLFCFPDGNEWTQLTDYSRETFSFVLTNVDGSRKIGYCRRLLPAGPGPRLPKVYCIISCIGCFGLFSKILDEVEKRHQISTAVIYPFMQGLREAAFPAPGKTVTLKSFIPDSGTEFISLTRPLDSHLEHVDFSALLHCLHFEQIIQIFASAVLERKIIFLAEGLSTLSQCIHAAAALLYPFSWAHTYIPVVPESLLATVCCPTPFMVGVQMRFQQEVMESPMEEVLLVNLCEGTFLLSVGDEKDILPPKLQDDILDSLGQGINELKTSEQINEHVSGPFVQFFVKTVGHYASYIKREASGQGHFQERSFCKAVTSKTKRRFVKKFVKTQLFSLFIQEAEKSRNPPAGYFQKKILEYEEQKKQKKSREKTVK